jgi:hypothetical protein
MHFYLFHFQLLPTLFRVHAHKAMADTILCNVFKKKFRDVLANGEQHGFER